MAKHIVGAGNTMFQFDGVADVGFIEVNDRVVDKRLHVSCRG